MTLAEITTAIKSIDVSIKIIKGISSFKKDFDIKLATEEILSKLIETKQQLLIFQSSYSEILSTNSELKKKIVEFENWETKTLNYSLIEITSGVHVYLSKESQDSGNKQPWFCAKCYNEKKLSPFQRKYPNRDCFVCHTCGSKFDLPSKEPPYQKPKSTGWMGA